MNINDIKNPNIFDILDMNLINIEDISCYDVKERYDRQKFSQYFGRYFKSIQYMDTNHWYDVSAVTYNNQVYLIEIKDRNMKLKSISASTMAEINKIQTLRKEYQVNSRAKVIYLNFCLDGYLVFNLSNRFNKPSSDILMECNFTKLLKNTLEDKGSNNRNVYLLVCQEDYQDRCVKYEYN
jgi:hypothetical protein